jgi:hypothetical protein
MKAHLRNWMPAYLGQGERESEPPREPGTLKVADWVTKTRLDSFPEDQIPMIVIATPGTVGKPTKNGKTWEATWLIRVTAICSAGDEETSQELADIYAHAIKQLVLQNKMINDNPDVEAVEWAGDAYNLAAAYQTRTLGAAQVIFHVTYKNVVDESEGPITPTPEDQVPADPGPWPTVKPDGVHVTIEKEPINGNV